MKNWLGADPPKPTLDRSHALEMPEGKARALVADANLHYPSHTWELVPVGHNLFIVEGTPKS
jgi:hypothetical protein